MLKLNPPRIELHYGIANTIAQIPAMKAFTELMELGLQDATITAPAWDDNAFVAIVDETVIGVLTWVQEDWCKTITVRLGWVHQEFRRQGIYRQLWQRLLDVARSKNVVAIRGGTHVNNIAMQKTMEKLGRQPKYLVYFYEVKEGEKNHA